MEEIQVIETIENRIFTIRGVKVMIDRDLAELYEVQTYRLNEAVKRNIRRFPEDFMFQLNNDEMKELIANCDRFKTLKHSSNPPYAFTEHGVSMLSSVLNSEKAIEINIKIIRAFIALRQYVIAQTAKNQEIEELRRLLFLYMEKNDQRVDEIICVLNNLIEQPREPQKIGFRIDKE